MVGQKTIKDGDYTPRDKKKEAGSNTIDITPRVAKAKK